MHSSSLLTSCKHLDQICNPKGLFRLSRAAETVFSSSNRPAVGTGKQSVPRCLHPSCRFPSSCDVHVCVQCVHMSCLSSCLNDKEGSDMELQRPRSPKPSQKRVTHLSAHFRASGHAIHISVEHGHLFCVLCNDFVYNKFLDGAIAMQSHIARAHRRSFTTSISPLDPTIQSGFDDEHSLSRNRTKKRRLVACKEWIPSEKELDTIAQNALPFACHKSKIRPPVGLFNLGNSCYMNSVLQAFLNAPPLRSFFLADEHRPHCAREPKLDCFACAMDQLICDSCFTIENDSSRREKNSSSSPLEVPFLVPQAVLDIVWRHAEHLATYAQHDAHEFLIAALNVLSAHCRREQSAPTAGPQNSKDRKKSERSTMVDVDTERELSPMHKDSSKSRSGLNPTSPVTNVRADPGGHFGGDHPVGSGTTSIVHNLFSGTLQSDVVCRVCGNSSPTLEKFYDISLDVDKLIKPASTRRSRAPSPAIDANGDAYGGTSSHGRHSQAHAGEDRVPRKSKQEEKTDASAGTATMTNIPRSAPDTAQGSKWDGDGDRELESANTLEECLSRFTEPELLGSSSKMHCASCGTRQEAMKQMSIRTLPPIVCLHFKRFEQSFASVRRSEMVKIDTPVEFPADGLDLAAFQTSQVLQRRQASESPDTKTVETALLAAMQQKLQNERKPMSTAQKFSVRPNEQSVYDLFAVVNHIGKIDSGHYTALIRRQGAWFRCDDEKVTRVTDMGRVIRSEEAYLVFYVQRFPNLQF